MFVFPSSPAINITGTGTGAQNVPDPLLPHERDETTEQQEAEPQPVIRQAQRDIEDGLEDTDLRGSGGSRQRLPGSPPRKE